MPTLTIGGNNYEAYAANATADTYLEADLRLGPIWAGKSEDDQNRALVTATRVLDRQEWKGEKVSDAQALEWPRTGVTDCDGDAVSSASVPQDIIDASILLAALIAENPSLAEQKNTDSNIESVKAGSAGVSFFKPVKGTRFPTAVHELIRCLLAGASTSVGAPKSYGTNVDSKTHTRDGFGGTFDLTDGFG